MITLLLVALLFQDPLEDNLKRLSDKDPAVREAATLELTRTPLDKLEKIEGRLKDADADVAARARRVMTFVLKSHVRLRPARFELRPMAPLDVVKAWAKAGADPKAPPKGYDLVRFADKAVRPSDYSHDWVPVEAACINSGDVEGATPAPAVEFHRQPDLWLVNLRLTDAGAAKFDTAAEVLFNRNPKGVLAIVFDDQIVSAPVVQSARFDGHVTITGSFSEAQAKDLASVLKTDRMKSMIRLEKNAANASTPEKALEAVRGIKGLEKLSLGKGDTDIEFGGFLTADDVDVILLWQTLRDQGYRLGLQN